MTTFRVRILRSYQLFTDRYSAISFNLLLSPSPPSGRKGSFTSRLA
jgi:hypothetical protein